MTDFAVGTEITGRDRASRAFRKVAGAVRGALHKSFITAGRGAKRLASGVASATTKVALLGAAAAAAAAVGVAGLVSEVAESGDQLAKFAKRADLTVQNYAELKHAASSAGVEAEEFDDAMKTFTKTVGEARIGTGPLAGLLKEVDKGMLASFKATKTNAEALDLMFKAMSDLEDPARRAMFAAAGFGEVGQKMTLMVDGGVEAIAAQRKEFLEYHGVVSKKGVKASEDFLASQGRVNLAIRGVKMTIASQLLPILSPMLTQLAKWIAANRELIGQKVSSTIAAIAKWLKQVDWSKVLGGIGKFVDGLSSALTFLWDIKEVIIGIAGASVLGKLVGGLSSASGILGKMAAAAGPLGAVMAAGVVTITHEVGKLEDIYDRLLTARQTKGQGFKTGSQVEELEKERISAIVVDTLTNRGAGGAMFTNEELLERVKSRRGTIGKTLAGGGKVTESEAKEVILKAREKAGVPMAALAAQLQKGTEARMQIDVNVVTQPGTKATVTGSAVQTTQPGAVAVKATVGTPTTRVTP